MEELRLTVTSTPTLEFPQNQNNKFKVRLPRPLVLPDGPWALSLWSLSVPDEAVEDKLGQGSDYVCRFTNVLPRLFYMQGGKYTTIKLIGWFNDDFRLSEVMTTKPKTGVEFWRRVEHVMDELRTKRMRNAFISEYVKDSAVRLQQAQAYTPTFRWEGEDWILQANKGAPYDQHIQGHPFAISLKIAQAFGFVKQDPITHKWSLGPNAVPSYPVYDQMPLATADFTTYKPQGPTLFVPHIGGKWNWIRIKKKGRYFKFDQVEFTNAVEWRFTNLNRSFAQLTNQLETVMVYTDAVQSNTVNHRQVPLLRSLHLHRRGRGRVTVEPKHREWIPLNGNTLEVMEFQLATASGPLTDLSPGQTIVTLGLTPIKA